MPIWISITIIIICLIIILFIVLRKFPALAILDAKEMPGEKEAESKERIIRQRLERDLAKANGFLARIKLGFIKFFNLFLDNYYRKLKKIKSEYKKEEKINPLDKKSSIEKLFIKAQEDKKQEDWEKAEASLIEIISLDDKNLLAFYDLGKIYFEWKKYSESLDTFQFALKLYKQFKNDPEKIADINPQEIRFSIAEVNLKLNKLDDAFEYISQALDNEPNNPRFLDLIFDISIMKKDKKLARNYYEKLVAVNPENQKLKELKEQISKIEDN
jgi:tetratricopeptide (TPR) repeat protein